MTAFRWLPPPPGPEANQYFYEHSLLQALSPDAIEEEKRDLEAKSVLQKVDFVYEATMKDIVKALYITGIFTAVGSAFLDNTTPVDASGSFVPEDDFCSLERGLWLWPLMEEIIHRGIIQDGIGIVQHYAREWLPDAIRENGIVRWFSGTSARIVASQSIFAAMHLNNMGTRLSTAKTIAQVAGVVLSPVSSILYETTGSLVYPLFSHLVNNLAACSLLDLREIMLHSIER